MKKLLILMMALILISFTTGQVYYDQQFNTDICSQLTFERADIGASAPLYSSNCTTSGGELHLNTRNMVISGFNVTSPLLGQDFWDRDLTYTILFQKSSDYSDFYISPFQFASNNIRLVSNPAILISENYSLKTAVQLCAESPLSLPSGYNVTNALGANSCNNMDVPSTAFDSLGNVLIPPIWLEYPTDYVRLYSTYSHGYHNPTNMWQIQNVNLGSAYTGECVDTGCSLQLFWKGSTTKTMTAYVDGVYLGEVTFQDYLGGYNYPYNWVTANLNDTLNDLYGAGVFISGISNVNVDIDRIILEDGNKTGYYPYGGFVGANPECSNGLDDDLDGLTDYPEDPSCSNMNDNLESPQDSSTCQEDTCSQATKCIYYTDFDCSDSLRFHGWTSQAGGIATLLESDGMKILLNKYLDRPEHTCFYLPNGSTQCLDDELYLYTDYSDNKKDYTQVGHKFLFYFINNYYQYDLTSAGTLNDTVALYFVGETNITDFAIKLVPTSMDYAPYDVNIEIFATNNTGAWVSVANTTTDNIAFYKFELDVISYKPTTTSAVGQYDFTYRSPDSPDTILSNWKYSGQKWNFLGMVDLFINSLFIRVAGDSSYTDAIFPDPTAETSIYLSSIDVKGIFDEAETSTQCTTWANPYILQEFFTGCINTCGWVTSPSPLCLYGALQATTGDEIFISKDTDYLTSDMNRYVTLAFKITPHEYTEIGGIVIDLIDSDSNPLASLLVSQDTLYSLSDGEYEFLSYLGDEIVTSVQLHIDLADDTFDLWEMGYLVSSNHKLANTLTDYTDISSFSLFSTGYNYNFDDLHIFTTDGGNIAVPSNTPPPASEVFNATKYCGHVLVSTPVCSEDSDCVSDDCLPTGKCNSFDMNYCDETGRERGNMCFASAMASCVAESTGELILNNFLSTLIIILFIVVMAFVVVMLRRKG